MLNIFLTKYDGAILGPIAKLLGYILEGLYNFFEIVGFANVGLCIIVFTVVVKMLMMPLTFKQQKFSKLSAVMNPEIQAIQAKYKDKKNDQQAMMKMQEETKMVYEKYGTSATGSCLQMLIQMPILFALYRVMMNIPAYIPHLKALYESVISSVGLQKVAGYVTGIKGFEKADVSTVPLLIDQLSKFSDSNWNGLKTSLALSGDTASTIDTIVHKNSLFGMNLSISPMAAIQAGMIIFVLVPILSGALQWYTTKLMSSLQTTPTGDNPMGNSMKMMNNIMPVFSAFICLTVSTGLGVYWIASSGITIIQQIIINSHFKKMDVNDIVKANIEKQNKKRAKKGLPPKKITTAATTNAKSVGKSGNVANSTQTSNKDTKTAAEKANENVKKSTDYYNSNAKPGSLAAKANMVKMYDEKKNNSKKK